jgi:regulator of sigma E protease
MDIITILIAIAVFCVIILVHELGHFLVAKAFHMEVKEFSIGMGPRIIKIKGKKTIYSIKLFPIGGSVQLSEDEESSSPNAFRNKPVWQRMLVIAAGAIMNLVLGFIVCIVSVSSDDLVGTTMIHLPEDSTLHETALKDGDEILKINGMNTWTIMDIIYKLQNTALDLSDANDGAYFDIEVNRNGEYLILENVKFHTIENNGEINILQDFRFYGIRKSFGNIIESSAKNFLSEARLIWITFIDLIRGTYGLNDLSGPIGVVDNIGEVAKESIENGANLSSLWMMISFITINIGIFNLLPIPALDGARLVFLTIEAIRRKPISAEREGMVHFVGIMLLMILMLVITFKDIWMLVVGG